MNEDQKLIEWLERQEQQVIAAENDAKALLEADADNDEGYRKKMLEKAEILASLYERAQSFINTASANIKYETDKTLKNFSQNAKTSIKLNSVFYMSALLYPDDYQEGQPNNFKIFIEKLKNLK